MAQIQPFANLLHVLRTDDHVFADIETTPLHFLVLSHAPLEMVQAVYEMWPDSLTSAVLRHACKFGASPGVVGFLAENAPASEIAKIADEEDAISGVVLAMLDGPGPGRPSEDEIKILATACSENWVTDDTSIHDYCYATTPCFRRIYSVDLICFLCNLVSDGVDSFELSSFGHSLDFDRRRNEDTLRREVDDDCLAGLAIILPKIQGKCIIQCENWKVSVFEECLDLLIQNEGIREVQLVLPSHIIASSQEARNKTLLLASRKKSLTLKPGAERSGHDALFELFQSTSDISYWDLCLDGFSLKNERALCGFPSNSNSSHAVVRLLGMDCQTTSGFRNMADCSIERLGIQNIWGSNVNNNLSFGLIKHAWRIPNLVSLTLEFWNSSLSMLIVPSLCKILDQGKLEDLGVRLLAPEHRGEPFDDTLLPVLEALRVNSSVKHFLFEEKAEHQFPNYTARLKAILKDSNTTLEHVKQLNFLSSHCARVGCEKGMKYYAALNRCGRRIAQSPETTMNDFINMLGDIPAKLEEDSPFKRPEWRLYEGPHHDVEYHIAEIDIATTTFELLQVSLDKWISPNKPRKSPTRGAKRKFSP